MKHLSIFIAFLFLMPTDEPYCSCVPRTIEERIDSAETIFKGEVVSIDTLITVQTVISHKDDGSKKEYLRPVEMTRTKLRIIQFLKGYEKLDYVSVFTTWRCCMCGFPSRSNATYFVFSNSEMISISKEKEVTWDQRKLGESSKKPEKVLFTSICDGTNEFLPQQMKEIIKYLDSNKNRR